MRADINAFVALKRIAVVGVSRKEMHFSRMVLKELVQRGYDVVVVHPEAKEIGGVPCSASIAAVQPPVEGAMILTSADHAAAAAQACVEAGVKRLWIYKGKSAPAGTQAVVDECPMMWLSNPAWYHAAHKTIRSIFGTLPA